VLEATNSAGNDTQNFTLSIGQAPDITSADSLTCEVGQPCSFTATADGFPAPEFDLPGLPAGLSLDPVSGELSGTPDAGTGAVYNLVLEATNDVGSDTQAFTLTVNEAPTITSGDNLACEVEAPCSFLFTADGHPDATFDLPGLPAGLSLDPVTGELTGAPDAGTGGTYNLVLEATNSAGNDTQNFTLSIGQAPSITSPDTLLCEAGTPCSFTATADGFPAPEFDLPGLPASLVLDPATGELSGAADAGTGGDYNLTLTATNSFGSDDQAFTLTVAEAPVANNDPDGGIPGDSSPGSMPYHGSFDSTLVVSDANGVLANDTLGFPQAGIVDLTPPTSAGGSVTLTSNGGFSYAPPSGFTGIDTFEYCLDNGINPPDCATVSVAIGERPSAEDHTFAQTLLGNTHIDTALSSNFSLFSLADGDGVSIAASAETNGEVIIDAGTGTFHFHPAAGHNGAASFEYDVSNGFGSATGTVTFDVQGLVWYFDNSAGGGGDGRLASPFNSLAAASAAAAGDVLFLHTGTGDYTGGISLLDNQVLVGHGSADDLEFHAGQTAPDDSLLPSESTEPVIANAGGHGIVLGNGNGIHGLHVGNTSGYGISGSNFGTLTVSGVDITGTGSGLNLDTGTVAGAGFGQVNATSGTHGILLTDVAGAVDLGGGAISGATTAAMELNGGTANVNYAGTLQPGTGGRPTLIQNKTAGTVALTGQLNSTQLGVRMANNPGATLRFAGGMNLSTGSNIAFQASGGGTIEVCDENPCNPGATGALVNTLTTTTATALDVSNTTIGANHLEFRSISAGTGASGPANGIVLENTGSAGGLKVRGSGTAGSGGTIQRTSGKGILLLNTAHVDLARMIITNSGDDGIDGTSVTHFALSDSAVTNNGSGVNHEGINFVNLGGTVALTNVTATGNAYHNLRIDNTSGTISSLAIAGGSYSNNNATIGNHGILIEPRGSSQITAATVSGATISGNRVMGMMVNAADSAVVSSFIVDGNTIQNNELGVDFSKSQTSSITYSLINNSGMTGHNSHGVNFFTAAGAGTTGTMNGTIQNNTIGAAGVDGSGSVIGNCLRVNVNGDTQAAIRVDGNTARECPQGRGLEAIGRNGTGGLDLTVTNNDIDHVNLGFNPGVSDFPLAAVMVQSNCVTVCNTVRSDVRGNTVPGGSSFDFTAGYITLIQSNASTLQLVDNPPGSANCAAQLNDNNTGSAGTAGTCTLIPGPINTP
jgi:hypothetical protein